MFPTLQSKITAQLSILYTYIQPKETGKEPKQDNTLLFCSKEQPEKNGCIALFTIARIWNQPSHL
jgi:hypothetical protein